MLIKSWPPQTERSTEEQGQVRSQNSTLPWLTSCPSQESHQAIKGSSMHTGEPPAYQRLLQTHERVDRHDSR